MGRFLFLGSVSVRTELKMLRALGRDQRCRKAEALSFKSKQHIRKIMMTCGVGGSFVNGRFSTLSASCVHVPRRNVQHVVICYLLEQLLRLAWAPTATFLSRIKLKWKTTFFLQRENMINWRSRSQLHLQMTVTHFAEENASVYLCSNHNGLCFEF